MVRIRREVFEEIFNQRDASSILSIPLYEDVKEDAYK
jgi:hypothetical protein